MTKWFGVHPWPSGSLQMMMNIDSPMGFLDPFPFPSSTPSFVYSVQYPVSLSVISSILKGWFLHTFPENLHVYPFLANIFRSSTFFFPILFRKSIINYSTYSHNFILRLPDTNICRDYVYIHTHIHTYTYIDTWSTGKNISIHPSIHLFPHGTFLKYGYPQSSISKGFSLK